MNLVANYRTDNNERWNAIKAQMGSLEGKTMVDIGCHNGWFCQQFLLGGGKSASGVEVIEDLIREINCIGMDNLSVKRTKEELGDEVFDFVLFLDLQYHKDIDYLEWCRNHGKLCFIAAAGNSGESPRNNERIRVDLMKWFKNVEPLIKTNYAGRMTYKCY